VAVAERPVFAAGNGLLVHAPTRPPSPVVEATTQGTLPPVTVGLVATAPTTITMGWAPVVAPDRR
jgi:hypothetical protein